MLENIYKYILFILFIGFIFILFFVDFSKNFSININFIYLFGVMILIFFDKILEFIKKDFSFYFINFDYKKNKKNLFLKIFVLVILTIIIFFISSTIINFLVLFFLVFSFIFKLDSRVSFVIALFLLTYTIFTLIVNNKFLAESFSIYAYYFLIIGVLLEITENLFDKKEENEKRI